MPEIQVLTSPGRPVFVRQSVAMTDGQANALLDEAERLIKCTHPSTDRGQAIRKLYLVLNSYMNVYDGKVKDLNSGYTEEVKEDA